MLLTTYPLISSYTHNGDDTLQRHGGNFLEDACLEQPRGENSTFLFFFFFACLCFLRLTWGVLQNADCSLLV